MIFAIDHPSIPFPEAGRWGVWLEENFSLIRQEWSDHQGTLIKHPNSDSLVSQGRWDILPLYKGGIAHKELTAHFPKTMRVIEAMPHCGEGLDGIGQVIFSRLKAGLHILPHRGSTNVRLRYHLTLLSDPEASLKVLDDARGWVEGQCFCFDDGLEHSVTHTGERDRVVLLIDLWHPQLSLAQRKIIKRLLA
jgi:aspartate beta-hydroxylase